MMKAVKELESGVSAEVVARDHGVTRATLYNWKSKYSGMDVSQVKRLKELKENRKLKLMYTDLALDNRILRDVIEKKTLEPEIKKQIAVEIVEEYELGIARACKLMKIHRSYYYYQVKRDDTEVEEAIRTAAQYGDCFWNIFKRLRREGKRWNHKKVYRVNKNIAL